MKRTSLAMGDLVEQPLEELLRTSVLLTRSFYERPTVDVAKELLGKILIHGETAGRIVEVEAYLGTEDRAAHAAKGLTARTRAIFGPAGHAYIYLIYGVYECLNIVTETDGVPGCVLIRALEPVCGIKIMKQRRPKTKRIEDLASGPGKLTLAMDITRQHYGCDLTKGPLTVWQTHAKETFEIQATPRIGIRQCKDWPLRFVIADCRFSRQLAVDRFE